MPELTLDDEPASHCGHALLEGMNDIVRRQDMSLVYRTNSAIYINNADEITLDTSFNDNEVGFVMSTEHSVDVDGLEDFACAERLLEARWGGRFSAYLPRRDGLLLMPQDLLSSDNPADQSSVLSRVAVPVHRLNAQSSKSD